MALSGEPSEDELAEAIGQAAGKAFTALFAEHPGRFYYCSLITTGEALPPVVTAWSDETLERTARNGGLTGKAWLDRQGVFGQGERRLGVVINVEVMPPDHTNTNTSRALRLNPQAALSRWLEECAEPLPE